MFMVIDVQKNTLIVDKLNIVYSTDDVQQHQTQAQLFDEIRKFLKGEYNEPGKDNNND